MKFKETDFDSFSKKKTIEVLLTLLPLWKTIESSFKIYRSLERHFCPCQFSMYITAPYVFFVLILRSKGVVYTYKITYNWKHHFRYIFLHLHRLKPLKVTVSSLLIVFNRGTLFLLSFWDISKEETIESIYSNFTKAFSLLFLRNWLFSIDFLEIILIIGFTGLKFWVKVI